MDMTIVPSVIMNGEIPMQRKDLLLNLKIKSKIF